MTAMAGRWSIPASTRGASGRPGARFWRGRSADDEILERVHRGLDRALGLREAPRALAVTRWPRAVPQPAPHHGRLVRGLRARGHQVEQALDVVDRAEAAGAVEQQPPPASVAW